MYSYSTHKRRLKNIYLYVYECNTKYNEIYRFYFHGVVKQNKKYKQTDNVCYIIY